MLYATDCPDAFFMDESHARELDVLSHVHEAERRAASASAHGASSNGVESSGTVANDTASDDKVPQGAPVSQRSIAQALGMSVGLTNAILKRLTEKGLLMMRRINAHNVHYLVTPDGIDQISRRSYLYLRRTIGHVVRYKERLRVFCRDQKERGIQEIILIGESDLAFLLEWCAEKEGLRFRCVEDKEDVAEVEPGVAVLPHVGKRNLNSSHKRVEGTPTNAQSLRILSERITLTDSYAKWNEDIALYEVIIGKS